MSPRQYRSSKRQQAAERTRRRIVEAVAALHAEQGGLNTTYAMIAKRADVAVPTVYNHFPEMNDLLQACYGHTMAEAPALGPQLFDGLVDVEARVAALIRGLFAFYRYIGPWLSWGYHEAKFVPELDALLRKASEKRRRLIALALLPRFSRNPPPGLLVVFEALLDFPAWQRLSADESLRGGEGERALAEAMIAMLRARPAARQRDRAKAHARNQLA